jgi:outer membrane biosynthesis protein TonB
MQLRQLIQPGITASVLAHVLLLGLIVLFSEVHPFGSVTAEPIAVDLVTPEEVPKAQDEKQDEKPPDNDKLQLQIPKDDVTAAAQQAASPPPSSPAAAPAKQQQQPAARPDRQAAVTPQPQPAQPAQSAQQQPTPSTPPPTQPLAPQQQPAYTPPEPDVTVKYGVMLGLPETLPPASPSSDKPGDGIDANASSAANISSSLIARFREHLRTCSRLPASVARSDNVFVKLRVLMTPQAKLAAEPILIEGSASAKALDLKDSAVRALSACQPYDMLPADRYGEWKVLDLTFTPQDLS